MRDENTRNQKGCPGELGDPEDRALRIPWMTLAAFHARSSLSKREEVNL